MKETREKEQYIGRRIELLIEDMSVEGQGIGRTEDGMVLFVDGAVKGDRVIAEVTKTRKRFAFAEVEEILEESPLRSSEFDCPYHRDGCGGCPLGELDYDAQLEIKEKQVRDRLERIAGIEFREADGRGAEARSGSSIEAGPEEAGSAEADGRGAEARSGSSIEAGPAEADGRGSAEAAVFRPIIGMNDEDNDGQGPWRYRNKATFPVSTGGIITKKGGVVENLGDPAVGFFEAKSHKVIDCGDCYLQSMAAVAAADALRRFMYEDGITGFDPRWEKGLMRHMIVRTAFATGEVMVILVINGKGIPGAPKLIRMLDETIAETGYSLESVVLNINRASGKNVEKNKNRKDDKLIRDTSILGDKYETLAGKPVIIDRVGELEVEISPASFFQVNLVQMKRLYDKVREYVISGSGQDTASALEQDTAAGAKPTILDLYCGVGSIGLYCADLAEKIIGIESVEEAVKDANRNSVINGIVNTRYVCGRAEEVLAKAANGRREDNLDEDIAKDISRADMAILDPPRSGCREELLDAIGFAQIPTIIYVSCDPATLARDISILKGKGYELIEAAPVDLFPHTNHCECVCLLSRERNYSRSLSRLLKK